MIPAPTGQRPLPIPRIQDLETYWGSRVAIIIEGNDDATADERRKRNRELDQGTAQRLDVGRLALQHLHRALEAGQEAEEIDRSNQVVADLIDMGAVWLLGQTTERAANQTEARRKKQVRYDLDLASSGDSNKQARRRARRRQRDVIAAESEDQVDAWSVSAVDLICPSPWQISNHVIDKPLVVGIEVQPVSEPGLRPARRMIMYDYQAASGRETLLALTGTSQSLGRSAKHLRMSVVSAGMVRVDLRAGPGNLAHEIKRLQATISGEIQDELARHGMELVFCALEAPLWLQGGVLYCHLHAHLLILQTRHLGPAAWLDYLVNMRQVSPRNYYRDAGQVRDLAELVKYVTKGAVSAAEEREATATGMVRTDVERLSPAQAVALAYCWHRRKRFRFFGRSHQLQKQMEQDRAKWCRDGIEDVDGKKVIKVGARLKGTREIAPKYDPDGKGSQDIVLGTSIRAIVVDGTRRLVPCVRVMSPSPSTMTTDLADLIDRRGLGQVADLAARLWADGLARHQPRGSSGAAGYVAHKTVNSVTTGHDGGGNGPPDLAALVGGVTIAA